MHSVFVGASASGVKGSSHKLVTSFLSMSCKMENMTLNIEGSSDSEYSGQCPCIEPRSSVESYSPLKSQQVSSICKHKSSDANYSATKRRQVSKIDKCLNVLNMSVNTFGDAQSRTPPSNYILAGKFIKGDEKYKAQGIKFFVSIMDCLHMGGHCEFFLSLEEDEAKMYWLDDLVSREGFLKKEDKYIEPYKPQFEGDYLCS